MVFVGDYCLSPARQGNITAVNHQNGARHIRWMLHQHAVARIGVAQLGEGTEVNDAIALRQAVSPEAAREWFGIWPTT